MIWAWTVGTIVVAGIVAIAGWYAIGLLDVHRAKRNRATCARLEIPDVEDLSRATDELMRQFRSEQRTPRTG